MARNARAKLRRIEKKHGIDLSKEIGIPKIDDIKTRKEFNEKKEQLTDFTNRYNIDYQFKTNEYGVTISRRRERDLENAAKLARRRARDQIERIKDLPYYVDGVKRGTVGDRTRHMRAPDITGVHIPDEFDFSKIRSTSRLKTVEKSLFSRARPEHYDQRKQQMKENFIKILHESFNSNADDVVKELEKLHPDDFYEMFLSDPSVFDFRLYDSEGQDVKVDDSALQTMMDYINDVKSGQFNMDMRSFD